MDNEEISEPLKSLRAELGQINRLQEERTQLIGIGAAERRRVTVTVNADGIAIDIKFSSDIGDLDYDEISAAITEASQRAVADVAEQTTTLFTPIAVDPDDRAQANEILRGFADVREQLR